MPSKREILQDGDRVKSIHWEQAGEAVTAGLHGCVSLTVRRTPGHMAMVPTHIQCKRDDGRTILYNINMIESIEPYPEDFDDQ